MRTKTRLVERDNLVFYNVTAVKVEYDLTGLRLRFDNLFEGVTALGEFLFQVLKDWVFWPTIRGTDTIKQTSLNGKTLI